MEVLLSIFGAHKRISFIKLRSEVLANSGLRKNFGYKVAYLSPDPLYTVNLVL